MKYIITIILFVFAFNLNAAKFSADRIEGACRNFIHEQTSSNYIVKFEQEFSDIEIGDDNVKAVFDEEYIRQKSAVKLDFIVGNEYKESRVYKFKLYKEVHAFTAKRYIPKHTKIDESMLERRLVEMEVSEIGEMKNVVGRIALEPIGKNDVVNVTNTVADVSVKRGEEVVIVASTGAVRIRAKGTALQDGRAGERIRIKRDGSRKILEGKVNENGELVLGE